MAAGLDEAILGGMNTDNPEMDGGHIERLLKHGAHGLAGGQGEERVREDEAFANEDITETLQRRTQRRTIGNRAGNTFSVATFTADAPKARIRHAACRISLSVCADWDVDFKCIFSTVHAGSRDHRVTKVVSVQVGEGEDAKDYWAALMPEEVAAFEAKVLPFLNSTIS